MTSGAATTYSPRDRLATAAGLRLQWLRGLLAGCWLLLLGSSCAIVSRPTGGAEDVTGPLLDTAASSPNFQLRHRPEEVVLEFDEFVVLKNASRDVILTPTPVSGKPTFAQRGRRVTVDFSDVVWRDSTTYQLQFGNTIQDLNEGNPALALRYIWSTGDFLDSLRLNGRVVRAASEAPLGQALVGLYRNLSDTALTRLAPDYFARADSSGQFLLDYLAPGTYQLAAYVDSNANYRLNQGSEAVAFLDSPLVVAPGRTLPPIMLRASVELAPLRVLRAEQVYPGLVRLTLNRPALAEIEVDSLPGRLLTRYQQADSIFLAYAPSLDSLPDVRVRYAGEVDSARFRKTLFATPPPLRLLGEVTALTGEAGVRLTFSAGLAGFELDSIQVQVDSTAAAKGNFRLDTLDRRQLEWRYPSDTMSDYTLTLLPGAVTGFAGQTLEDSVVVTVRPRQAKDFGELTLVLDSLRRDLAYVVELTNEDGKVERRFTLPAPGPAATAPAPTSDTLVGTAPSRYYTNRRVLARVPPATYTVVLVEDVDADGRYSAGERRLRRQPERLRRFPIEQVRADWTLEQRVVVGE